jgi:hypothetical protein
MTAVSVSVLVDDKKQKEQGLCFGKDPAVTSIYPF